MDRLYSTIDLPLRTSTTITTNIMMMNTTNTTNTTTPVRGLFPRTRFSLQTTSRIRGPVSVKSGTSDLSSFRTGLSQHLEQSITTKTFAASDGAGAAGDASVGAGGDLIEVALEEYETTVAELSSEGRILVMDFYTQWCGPCKLMKPTLVEWSESMAAQGVSFRSFEASKKNAPIGKALSIKSVPTLIVYKDGSEVARVVGNKLPALKEAIEAAL